MRVTGSTVQHRYEAAQGKQLDVAAAGQGVKLAPEAENANQAVQEHVSLSPQAMALAASQNISAQAVQPTDNSTDILVKGM